MTVGRLPEVRNIGDQGRRRRLAFGVVATLGGLAIVALNMVAVSRAWLVAVFALFFLGSLGALQSRGHT